MIKYFYRDSFFSNVSFVAAGSGISQAIALLTTPIVTRIYAPDDFGQFGVFLSFISICAVIGCLRYELALPLIRSLYQSAYFLRLLLLLSLSVSVITWAAYYFLEDVLYSGHEANELFLVFFPVVFICVVFSNIFNILAIREKIYSLINKAKILQSASQALSKIALGFVMPGSSGLLLGYAIGLLVGLFIYFSVLKTKYLGTDIVFTKRKTSYFLLKNKRFVIYSAPGSLINVLSTNLPVLMIISIYGVKEAGLFVLANSVVGVPLSVIGGAVANVFYSEGASIHRNDKNSFWRFYVDVILKIVPISFIMGVSVYLIGNYGFIYIFGDEWEMAGIYAGLLSVLFVCRFVASSVANALTILRRQHISLYFHVALLVCTVSVFTYASNVSLSVYNVIMYYSLTMSLVYLSVIAVTTYVVKTHNTR